MLSDDWFELGEFPGYEIHPDGHIRRLTNERLIRPRTNQQGVVMVSLRREGVTYTRAMNKLVLTTFGPPQPERTKWSGFIPCHIDGDRTNCNINNLEWRKRSRVYKETLQEKRGEPLSYGKIIDLTSGKIWNNSKECARDLDLLEEQVIDIAFWGGGNKYYRLDQYP